MWNVQYLKKVGNREGVPIEVRVGIVYYIVIKVFSCKKIIFNNFYIIISKKKLFSIIHCSNENLFSPIDV